MLLGALPGKSVSREHSPPFQGDLCIKGPKRDVGGNRIGEGGGMQKKAGQLSLADGLVRGANNFLGEADGLIDWSEIEQQLEGIYSASKGRPSYPLLTLFKAMLLQQWYGLSDSWTEEAITDSISFRRFVGLSLAEAVPDHSTLSRFRAQLGNRFTKLQEAFNRQLDRRGLIVRQGTLIDASFVQSSSRKSQVDPEAGAYGRHH